METTTFRTVTEVVPNRYKLGVNDSIFLIGSCFVDSVGERLKDGLLPVCINPYGTVYNPTAIRQQLERIIDNRCCDEDELVYSANRWHSRHAHSSLSSEDKVRVIDNVNEATRQANDKLSKAKCLIVTFGTAWVYRLSSTGEVVANCHKLPAGDYRRELLTVDEIVRQWTDTINNIRQYNNGLKILFTVSPIRHLKETAHGNQVSKATLLLAIDKLVENNSFVDYFPSYEIMLDDLRDYRFYADDMVHPSRMAVDYIYNIFAQTYFDGTALSYINEAKKITQAINHRNMGDNEAYANFIASVYQRSLVIKEKYKVSECNEVFTSAVKKISCAMKIL